MASSPHTERRLPRLVDHPKAIRLLKISGYDDETGYITCTTRSHILNKSNKISYVALSHVWGTESATYKILVNGETAWIRPNLWSLLQYIALARNQHSQDLRNSYVWIDALCVDQESNREKSRQVPLMGSIFAEARRVVGYLCGADAFDTPRHDSNAKVIASLMELTNRSSMPLGNIPVAPNWPAEKDRVHMVAAIIRLLEHPYWSRLWIVQEITLGQDVEFVFGTQVVPWSTIRQLILKLNRICKGPLETPMDQVVSSFHSSPQKPHGWRDFPIFDFLPLSERIVREELQEDRQLGVSHSKASTMPSNSLFELAKQYQNHSCSIARDRIYGLLAIADEAQSLHVDYTEHAIITAARIVDSACENRSEYCSDDEIIFVLSLLEFPLTKLKLERVKLPVAAVVAYNRRWCQRPRQTRIDPRAIWLPPPSTDPNIELCPECLQLYMSEIERITIDQTERDVIVLALPWCNLYMVARIRYHHNRPSDTATGTLFKEHAYIAWKDINPTDSSLDKIHFDAVYRELFAPYGPSEVVLYEDEHKVGVLFESAERLHTLLENLWKARHGGHPLSRWCQAEQTPLANIHTRRKSPEPSEEWNAWEEASTYGARSTRLHTLRRATWQAVGALARWSS